MFVRMSVVILGLTALASQANAGFFFDDFFSYPFTTGSERWCERWHDVSWNQTTFNMRALGAADCDVESPPNFGSGCCPGTTCDPLCIAVGAFAASTAPGNAAVLYTHKRLELTTTGITRTVAVRFGLQSHLTQPGEHVAVLPVTHPVCHANFQAIVAPDLSLPTGNYLFSAAFIDSSAAGFPECGQWFGYFSQSKPVTLVTSTGPPRYEVRVYSQPLVQIPGALLIIAELWDSQPGFYRMAQAGFGLLTPAWYNVEAKRFGFGGQFDSIPTLPVVFDNFIGVAQ